MVKRKKKVVETPYSLYVHKKNQVDMIRDRGYSIPDEEEDVIRSFYHFNEALDNGYNSLGDVLYTTPNRKKSIYVLYLVNEEDLKAAERLHDEDKTIPFIFIHYPTLKAIPTKEELPAFQFQYLPYDFFAINPTSHCFSNKYRLFTPSEQKIFMAKTALSPSELSGISINDALVKYYNAPLGSVFEIITDLLLPLYILKYPRYVIVRNVPIIYSTTDMKQTDDIDEEDMEDIEEEDVIPEYIDY